MGRDILPAKKKSKSGITFYASKSEIDQIKKIRVSTPNETPPPFIDKLFNLSGKIFLIYLILGKSLGILGFLIFECGSIQLKQEHPLFANQYPLNSDGSIYYLILACLVSAISAIAVWKKKPWGLYLLTANEFMIFVYFCVFPASHRASFMAGELLFIFILLFPARNQVSAPSP